MKSPAQQTPGFEIKSSTLCIRHRTISMDRISIRRQYKTPGVCSPGVGYKSANHGPTLCSIHVENP